MNRGIIGTIIGILVIIILVIVAFFSSPERRTPGRRGAQVAARPGPPSQLARTPSAAPLSPVLRGARGAVRLRYWHVDVRS